jgi:hypothetical protein
MGYAMKWKIANLQTCLYVISAVILLIGLGSAILIYRAAMIDSNSDLDYEVIGGFVYQNNGGQSKKYVHDLQLYGGQAAVLADEFMRWFVGLWHGKSLAITVACIAFLLSFGVFVAAKNVPSRLISNTYNEKNRDGTEDKLNRN